MGSWITMYSCLSSGIYRNKISQVIQKYAIRLIKTVLGLVNVVIDKVSWGHLDA